MRDQPFLEAQRRHVVFVIIQHLLELAVAVAAEQAQRGGIIAADLQPHRHAVALQGSGFSGLQQSRTDPAPGIVGMNGNGIEPSHRCAAREQQQHVAQYLPGFFHHQGNGMTAGQQMAEAATRQAVGGKALFFQGQQGRNVVQSGEARHGDSRGFRTGGSRGAERDG